MKFVHPFREDIRFGPFDLDVRTGELRKRGVKVKLQEQPRQLLQILLEHPGEVVTREELRQRIWHSDTFVDFDHGLYNAIKRLREALSDSAETPHFIETISRRGYRFIGPLAVKSAPIGSLAVLPLENLSPDAGQDYFATGLTEALITTLAKIGALRVISRNSVMFCRGTTKSLREIASQLQVDALVQGTVLCSGGRVLITVQLIRADNEAHLWAESYDRNLQDVITLQGELARTIAGEVQVKLTPQEKARFRRKQRVDPDAYAAYLKGRHNWNKHTIEAIVKGAEYFQQAIEIDPTYAAAYSGLADSACALGFWGLAPPGLCGTTAKAAAQLALEVDKMSAEAHASLAWAMFHFDLDFLGAESEFRQSIKLDPNCSTAAQWYALTLASMGRTDQALAEMQRAKRLDPLSFMINVGFGWVLWMARNYEQSIEQCQTALELDPSYPASRLVLGLAYEKKGMQDAAISELEKAAQLAGGAASFTTSLGYAYATAGENDKALGILKQVKEQSNEMYVMPYCTALIYAGLNEKDEAFHWLERAYQERSSWLVFTKMDPRLDSLRSDPRFGALLARLNYPSPPESEDWIPARAA